MARQTVTNFVLTYAFASFLALGLWIARLWHFYPDSLADTPSICGSTGTLGTSLSLLPWVTFQVGLKAPDKIKINKEFEGRDSTALPTSPEEFLI